MVLARGRSSPGTPFGEVTGSGKSFWGMMIFDSSMKEGLSPSRNYSIYAITSLKVPAYRVYKRVIPAAINFSPSYS